MSHYDQFREKQAEDNKNLKYQYLRSLTKTSHDLIIEKLDKIEMILEKLIDKLDI